jgi:pyruvate dehydrogenase E2 component (dihydrolipoamide acetyltransferase)
MSSGITPIIMPKWGLNMKEGTVVSWLVDEGTEISVGMPILEVETDKIANAVEAPDAGLLRRKTAQNGELLPVKALLGVLAAKDVTDADIDAYVAGYVTPASEEGDGDGDAAQAYEFADVNGIRIRYVRRGDEASAATPVLLIHGFGGDLDNWLFNIDAIAARNPVIALDLPAHGQSTVRLPGTSLRDLARYVLAFLDAIGVTKVHAVGHSMGGAIAAQLAREAPDRVASVTLISGAGLGEEISGDYINGFVDAASRRELKPVVERLFADPGLVTRQLLDDLLKFKRLDGVSEALASLAVTLFAGNRQTEQPARNLPAALPVLVIWGESDRVIPASHASNAPGHAKVVIVKGAGHMVQMEKASEVNALITAFVRA